MISYGQFYKEIIVEGGNVFKQHPTVRINLHDVWPTVDFLSRIVGINLRNNLLGSTGKRPTSGDIDIAIPGTEISKIELYEILKNWCEERNLNPADYIARSGISVHFRTPIQNQTEQYVQTDFMVVDDVHFAQFILANNETPPFNGKHQSIVLSNLAKNLNLKLSINGLIDRTTNTLIENKNTDRIAQILLKSPNAKTKDLDSIKSIMSYLLKQLKDPNLVLTALDESRQTILKTSNLDIAVLINAPHQIHESTNLEGKRVGVQHLYSEYKPDQYSMSFENFKELVYTLKDNSGVINPANSSVSEKADGLSIKFGVTPEDKFFLQGSYTEPVTDGNFEGKIKHEPTKRAFTENFKKIKELVFNILYKYKKNLDLGGIRVQAEWLYSPFALSREENSNLVYFVATNYERDKLGSWSTFPIINITDFWGRQISENLLYDITNSLVNLSNEEVKFLPLNIDVFEPIDLSREMRGAIYDIESFETQNPDYESVLYSTSRKRPDQEEKKKIRQKLIKMLLPHQKQMHLKILNVLGRLAGKLGEYEGIVIKLKRLNGEPFMFKIINPKFHTQKGRAI